MIYEIAGRRIKIMSIYDEVHKLCEDYIVEDAEKQADFTITTTQADIDYERARSAREDEKEGIAIRQFTDSYLETLAVYRKMAEQLLKYDTLLFHGSVIAVDGKGYLFTAKSGTGKSTHTGLWREYFGERAVMVNDDKPLLQMMKTGVLVYGTPWDGKHRLSNNMAVPLQAICILNRGKENRVEEITPKEAYALCLQQTHRPTSSEGLQKTLLLLDRLLKGTGLFRLYCNMDLEAAKVAYEGMNK